MMVWAGLVLGLLAFNALRWWPEPSAPVAPPPALQSPVNPWAESERSRDILREQEGAPAQVLAAHAPGEAERAEAAVRVIDGDTFELGGMRVRVADIDTPETRGRCAYESELAARATGRMRALLAAGPFELHPAPGGRDEDRYGRKLRIVTRNGLSLGDQLVAEGLARTWSGRREPWCG